MSTVCDHSGTHSGATRYVRESAQLRLVVVCDSAGPNAESSPASTIARTRWCWTVRPRLSTRTPPPRLRRSHAAQQPRRARRDAGRRDTRQCRGKSMSTAASEPQTALTQIGVVVHPTRPIDEPLGYLREWTGAQEVDLVQVHGSQPPARRRARRSGRGLRSGRVDRGRRNDARGHTVGAGGSAPGARDGLRQPRRAHPVGPEGSSMRSTGSRGGDWIPRGCPPWTSCGRTVTIAGPQRHGDRPGRAGPDPRRRGGRRDPVLARGRGDGVHRQHRGRLERLRPGGRGPVAGPGTDAFLLTLLAHARGLQSAAGDRRRLTARLEIDGGYRGARVELDGQATEPSST